MAPGAPGAPGSADAERVRHELLRRATVSMMLLFALGPGCGVTLAVLATDLPAWRRITIAAAVGVLPLAAAGVLALLHRQLRGPSGTWNPRLEQAATVAVVVAALPGPVQHLLVAGASDGTEVLSVLFEVSAVSLGTMASQADRRWFLCFVPQIVVSSAALTALGQSGVPPVVALLQLAVGMVLWLAHREAHRTMLDAVAGRELEARLRAELETLNAALRHRATHDPLTGLANRSLFEERLGAELTRTATGSTGVGVVYIDLDHFKAVNDTLGHAVGDALLQAVGERIASAIRADDLCARIGGDEFTVLLPAWPPTTTWRPSPAASGRRWPRRSGWATTR